MKKMCFCLLLLAVGFSANSQDQIQAALIQADSLFKAKKYTESFEIYDHLLEAEKQSSPAMLLKMAFIKEGLGDISSALYYLNIYHLRTSDEKTLPKMEDLAAKYQLLGYESNDMDFARGSLIKYYDYIIYFLIALAVFLFALVYRNRVKYQEKGHISAVFMVIVLGILFVMINFGRNYNKAIVGSSNAYLMSGPSAGAEVIDIIDKGHRIEYQSEEDIWVKVLWKEQTAYIKKNKLKYIHF